MGPYAHARFLMLVIGFALAAFGPLDATAAPKPTAPRLARNRFFTFVGILRVNQIEARRDRNVGSDETAANSVENVRALRDAFGKAFPGGRMTWALSWLALNDTRSAYSAARAQIVEYHQQLGDEVTFFPAGYFGPMYNTREELNRDLHDGLRLVSQMVGNGYRPSCVVAGYLPADSLRYLAEVEHIHVCQANIWSQHAIDNGDGDGSPSYPYFPSREHFLKPAQSRGDLIDCVNLDGWTCDFLAARRNGFEGGFNSRMGLGPIETVGTYGKEKGLQEQLATVATHFDDGFHRNGFAWVTAIWEVALVPIGVHHSLPDFGETVRKRWPSTLAVTEGEFGLAWRKAHRDNSKLRYEFVQRGSGIGGSDANMEIHWYMNRHFRLAILHDWTKPAATPTVIDFTRYDVPAQEPQTPARDWSLMNRINQKGTRPQDRPTTLANLSAEDRELIRKWCPELFR